MKIRDLVILVKYAQGLVVFDSFMKFIRFIPVTERKLHFKQIGFLIMNMDQEETDLREAIAFSGISQDRVPLKVLEAASVSVEILEAIDNFSEIDLESSTKLLLSIFTVRYQRRFVDHVNDPYRFWYWDFKDVNNTLKYLSSFNDGDSVELSNISF